MHPILIQITPSFYIGTYGVMIALGLFAAIALCIHRGRSRGVASQVVVDLAFYAVLSGFVAARVLFVLQNWSEFLAHPKELLLSRTGFVFLGGFMGAVATCLWFLRQWKLSPMVVSDTMVPGLPLAHAFGRLGCHFAGCCFGAVCEAPIGLRVPLVRDGTGEPLYNAYLDHLMRHLIPPGAASSLPVWPVQLLEAGGLFAICAMLVLVGTRSRRPGLLLGLYLVLYGMLRFGLEMLRGDAVRGGAAGLSTSQWISVAGLLPAGVAVLWWAAKSRKAKG